MQEIVMILGNPGTGKSTLLNCLVGRPVFRSGLTDGAGMGTELQICEADNGVVYMDTPGLADCSHERKAIEAIRAGLARTGSYRLFFTVRLEGGRVVQEDVVTIDRVLSAIKLKDLKFSVIVNKISKAHYQAMERNPQQYRTTLSLINSGQHTTKSVHLVPMLEDLEEQPDVVIPLPQPFLDFVNNAPRIVIKTPNVIGDIAIGHEVELLRQGIGRKTQDIMKGTLKLATALLGLGVAERKVSEGIAGKVVDAVAATNMFPGWEHWMVAAIGSVALVATAAVASTMGA